MLGKICVVVSCKAFWLGLFDVCAWYFYKEPLVWYKEPLVYYKGAFVVASRGLTRTKACFGCCNLLIRSNKMCVLNYSNRLRSYSEMNV